MNNIELHRQTFAKVNIDNLKFNVRALKTFSSTNFFCPMVKSNAYGHGDKEIVSVLIEEGVQQVGVALVEEGLRLRSYGFAEVGVLIFGAIKKNCFAAILENNLTPVISNWTELKEFSDFLSEDHSVHLKFNTGMNRFGFSPADAGKILEFIKGSFIKVEGVCSHFYDGSSIEMRGGSAQKQLSQFQTVTGYFPKAQAHMHNSSSFLGIIVADNQFFDIGSRIGLAIYGSYPHSSYINSAFPELKPVMSLQSEVVEYQSLSIGDVVSYGGVWKAQRKSIIGIVPIGYTDGYGREFSNKGKMLFRGQFVPVVGKVCMDYTMVDLTDVLKNEDGIIGEPIVLFGEQQELFYGVESFAEQVGKIPYEVLTTLGRRVPRKYVSN